MNVYLLDANVLIRAFRSIYPMDVHPGFWEWLHMLALNGTVHSVEAVNREVKNQELRGWIDTLPAGFFAPSVGDDSYARRAISDWVNTQEHTVNVKREFLHSADCDLISHALATGSTIVTFEVPARRRKNVIRIPDVCNALQVKTTSLQRMLSREGARFVLDPAVRASLS